MYYLRAILTYYPDIGGLAWNVRPVSHFATERAAKTWNARWADMEAFTTVSNNGFTGVIDWKRYAAQRVIWKLVTGEDPEELIDHVDRNNLNNRWINLRQATKGQNNINTVKRTGVCFDRFRNKYVVAVECNGKRFRPGRFDTLEEALLVRAALVKKLFGEFAP